MVGIGVTTFVVTPNSARRKSWEAGRGKEEKTINFRLEGEKAGRP